MVRNLSKRLKGTNFGISPHYPPEVLEKRKKLIPVMLKERQENKKAYMFEIFQEHTLRALFTLPFSLISLSADPYSFHNVPFTNSLSPTM
jgi:hypothetical protein